MIRRPPRSTPFPTRRPSDLRHSHRVQELPRRVQREAQPGDNEGKLPDLGEAQSCLHRRAQDRKSTRLNSSHSQISYAVFCLKKKKTTYTLTPWLQESKCKL